MEQPGHPVLSVDHQGLHETKTVCASQDVTLSCSTGGGTAQTVDVTWVERPSPGASIVDAGEHGWWEVDQNLLLPLDQAAHAVSDQPVTVQAAGAWDAGSVALPSVGGLGAWPAVAILVLIATGLGLAVRHRLHRQAQDGTEDTLG